MNPIWFKWNQCKTLVRNIHSFINNSYHKLYTTISVLGSKRQVMYDYCVDNGVFWRLRTFVWNIMIIGLLVWISLIPIIGLTPIWYVTCYGTFVWTVIYLWRELRRQ